jgi:uncharacterized protein YajQ (UPF0234 family)
VNELEDVRLRARSRFVRRAIEDQAAAEKHSHAIGTTVITIRSSSEDRANAALDVLHETLIKRKVGLKSSTSRIR